VLPKFAFSQAVTIPIPGKVNGIGYIVHRHICSHQMPFNERLKIGEMLCNFLVNAPACVVCPMVARFAVNLASDGKGIVPVAALVIMADGCRYAVSLAAFLEDFRSVSFLL
jgi:hypothetical protein